MFAINVTTRNALTQVTYLSEQQKKMPRIGIEREEDFVEEIHTRVTGVG